MPLYEFVCQQCHAAQELLLRGDEAPTCEKCGSSHLAKLLSVPAAHAAANTTQGRRDFPPAGSCGAGCGCHPASP